MVIFSENDRGKEGGVGEENPAHHFSVDSPRKFHGNSTEFPRT